MTKKHSLIVPSGVQTFTRNVFDELTGEEVEAVVKSHTLGYWDREHPALNVIEWLESLLSERSFNEVYQEFSRSRNDKNFDYLQNYRVLSEYWSSRGKNKSCTGRILTTHRLGEFSTVWAITDFCVPDCREPDPRKEVNGQPQVLTTVLFPSEY